MAVTQCPQDADSTQALVNAMKEFQSMGIDFISYQAILKPPRQLVS